MTINTRSAANHAGLLNIRRLECSGKGWGLGLPFSGASGEFIALGIGTTLLGKEKPTLDFLSRGIPKPFNGSQTSESKGMWLSTPISTISLTHPRTPRTASVRVFANARA